MEISEIYATTHTASQAQATGTKQATAMATQLYFETVLREVFSSQNASQDKTHGMFIDMYLGQIAEELTRQHQLSYGQMMADDKI